MVFVELKTKKNVRIPSKLFEPDQSHICLRKFVYLKLLEQIANLKASKKHGYYIAVTSILSIGQGEMEEESGDLILPVSFKCFTAMYFKGEILVGIVDKIMNNGLSMKAGPAENVFLPRGKMGNYKYRTGGDGGGELVKENGKGKIGKGSKVRFRVLEVKWDEEESEFSILAGIMEDYLGPI